MIVSIAFPVGPSVLTATIRVQRESEGARASATDGRLTVMILPDGHRLGV